jgi:hypothetical protein
MKILTLIFILACLSCNGQQNSKSLKDELESIYGTDQFYREKISRLTPSDIQFLELWKKQEQIDSLNLKRAIAIIDSIGIPGPNMVGDSASKAIFFVIQHSNINYQEKYLPLFIKSAENGELEWKLVALMIDRIKVNKKEKQIYGTQLIPIKDSITGYITDKCEFAPIEDEKNVNLKRKSVGLGTIEEYAKKFGMEYKFKDQ